MKLIQLIIFAVVTLIQSFTVFAKEQLFILPCKATSSFHASVHIHTGNLSTINRKIENRPFDISVFEMDGFVKVQSSSFTSLLAEELGIERTIFPMLSFSNNVNNNPEHLIKLRVDDAKYKVLAKSGSLKGTTTFDLSDYGFFMSNDIASLNLSRGTRQGGLSGFFTEQGAGQLTTISFECGKYSQNEWRGHTKAAIDYFANIKKTNL